MQDGILPKETGQFLCEIQISFYCAQSLLTFIKRFDILIVLGPSCRRGGLAFCI